jgi:sugar-phosphatase
VSANDVSRGKPAPDPFLTALSRLRSACNKTDSPRAPRDESDDISPARCVVIEDSLPGIAAARAAGMRTVGVTTNHPADRLAAADLVVAAVTSLDLATLDALVGSAPEGGALRPAT